jgi:hypothetical protein
MTPALVTLFGDREGEPMNAVNDDLYYGGSFFDTIGHIFNQAKQAIGAIDIKTPSPNAAPVAVAPHDAMAMLKNPVVIGGAVLVGALIFLKKGRRK